MAIIIIDGFEFYEGSYLDKNPYKNPIFNLTEPDIENKIKYLIENKIKKVSISTNFRELEFLNEMSFIEYITIGNSFYLDKLTILKNLKHLSINNGNRNLNLDLSKLITLEFFSIDWVNKFPNLKSNIFLKELEIWKFKPKSKSIIGILLPKSLENFHITETNIINFEGLEETNLNKLEAYYCNNLTSLKGLSAVKSTLKTVQIENAKNLKDFDDLWACENIERLILVNCGIIPTLNKLKNLKNLKMFTFNKTTVEDGNLAPLKNIDYIYFKNEKHYNMKLKDFNMQ
jgi:hypothetical protein